jgi:hypothetical protein
MKAMVMGHRKTVTSTAGCIKNESPDGGNALSRVPTAIPGAAVRFKAWLWALLQPQLSQRVQMARKGRREAKAGRE